MKSRRILMFGPPGAGKSTQANRLAKALEVPHVYLGEMLREHEEAETEIGRQAGGFMEKGELVPDEIVIQVLADRLGHRDAERGFVLDGFPRTTKQAVALDNLLGRFNWSLGRVINISVPDGEIIKRLMKRARAEGRSDDADPDLIRHRIDEYRERSEPCLAYYRPRDIVRDVDGVGTVDHIFSRIEKALLDSADRIV